MTNIFKMDDISLRHVHPDDYDALFALNAIWDIVKNTGSWSYPPDPDQVRNRCTPIDATDGIRGVITQQGRVIGQAGLAGDMTGSARANQLVSTRSRYPTRQRTRHSCAIGWV